MSLINYFKHSPNSWVPYFIRNSLDTETFAKKPFNAEALDVVLTIDGVKCDFIEVVEKMGANYQNEVNLAAAQLTQERMDKYLFRRLHNISEHAERLEEAMQEEMHKILADERKESLP